MILLSIFFTISLFDSFKTVVLSIEVKYKPMTILLDILPEFYLETVEFL